MLRLTGGTDPAAYSNPPPGGDADGRVCVVCMGSLQCVDDPTTVPALAEMVRQGGHDGTTYSLAFSVPSSTVVRQRAILAFLSQSTYGLCAPPGAPARRLESLTSPLRSVRRCLWACRLPVPPKFPDIKDVLKWTLGRALEQPLARRLDNKVGDGRSGAPRRGAPLIRPCPQHRLVWTSTVGL